MSNDDSIESARDFSRRLVHWIYEGTFLQGNEPSLELVQLINARDKAVARRAAEAAWEEGWNAFDAWEVDALGEDVPVIHSPHPENPYATPEESDDD